MSDVNSSSAAAMLVSNSSCFLLFTEGLEVGDFFNVQPGKTKKYIFKDIYIIINLKKYLSSCPPDPWQ